MERPDMRRPPFDPELEAALSAYVGSPINGITAEMIAQKRADEEAAPSHRDSAVAAGVTIRDVTATSYDGSDVVLSLLTHERVVPGRGAIYFVHGGGMIFGNRWSGVERLIPWVTDFGLPLVTVDYRLAPEHPHPAPFEDTYAGYVWMLEHATEIGVDPERIVLVGTSAGGGLAAATALAARDRGIQPPIAQLLMYPMLDDRDATVSTHQFSTGGLWDRISNDTGWTALLGDARGSADVPSYAAPARAQDLANLPPAFIDCGSAEVFRDEDVAYATGIWAAGGEAELHVWPGGFHSFEGFVPEAALSREMTSSREAWLRRVLGF